MEQNGHYHPKTQNEVHLKGKIRQNGYFQSTTQIKVRPKHAPVVSTSGENGSKWALPVNDTNQGVSHEMFLLILHQEKYAQDIESCPQPPKHYSELGCKPIQDEGHKCPNRYECPTLTDRDGEKCYFNGHVYDVDSSLSMADQELVSCSPACRCNNRTTPASFVCAHIDCPEFFGRDDSCVYQYTSRGCCSSNKVCGKEVEKLDVCYLDGEQYMEGQKMYPKDESCHTCHCQKGFDNSTVVGNPNCYEFTCGIEVHNSDSVMQGCIPIYFGTDRCCPISWRCPDDKDTVIVEGRLDVDEPVDPKMQCTFGKLKLNYGDSISSDDKCVSCKCTVPPMPHCIQSRDC